MTVKRQNGGNNNPRLPRGGGKRQGFSRIERGSRILGEVCFQVEAGGCEETAFVTKSREMTSRRKEELSSSEGEWPQSNGYELY